MPDGDLYRKLPTNEDQSSSQNDELDIGVKQVLKSSAFWHIAMGFMCHILVVNAVITHAMPYLSSIGITRSLASIMAGAIPLTSIAGRLGFGWLGDKFDKRRIAALGFVLTSLGLFSLGYVTIAGASWLLVPSIVILGIGYGGPIPMMPALLREYFGKFS